MQQISRVKRQEVVQQYVLGHPYEEIARITGVSHGTVANIVKEIDSGEWNIAESAFDQINDLRQLSLDLKKKKLEPSHALFGLLLFERLRSLGISLETVDKWSELSKRFTPTDFPSKEFFAVALRLHDLEHSVGKPFEELTEEYRRQQESSERLVKEINSLKENKLQLSREIAPLIRQLESTKRAKEKLEDLIGVENTRLEDLKARIKELAEDRSRLNRQVKELARRETELSAHVEGREESLLRLNEIGLADEDLLRLRAFFQKMSETEGLDPEQAKNKFFLVLSLFRGFSDLEKAGETEAERVKTLVKEKSVLDGEIKELEKVKSTLDGEIDNSVLSISQKIQGTGEEAVRQIEQQVADIRKQLDNLFTDALKAGEVVGQMSLMVKQGEESQKGLEIFLQEARSRLEVR